MTPCRRTRTPGNAAQPAMWGTNEESVDAGVRQRRRPNPPATLRCRSWIADAPPRLAHLAARLLRVPSASSSVGNPPAALVPACDAGVVGFFDDMPAPPPQDHPRFEHKP